jgi:hypothetical protein
MESSKAKRADGAPDIKKFPMLSKGSVGLPINCGAAAIEGEANRLGIKPTRLPNGRDLFSFEQAEKIILSIMRRAGTRA